MFLRLNSSTCACAWLGLGVVLLLEPGCVHAQSGVRWSTNYYDVTGSSIGEIRRSMKRNRPAQVQLDALTEWNIKTRFGITSFRGGQRVVGFTTATSIRITLPRWTPDKDATDSVQEAWDCYITALTRHEAGHAQFALTTAAEMHRRINSIGAAMDPGGLEARVQSVVLQTTEEFKAREREYDRLTKHGVTQGASLSLPEKHDVGLSPSGGTGLQTEQSVQGFSEEQARPSAGQSGWNPVPDSDRSQ